MRRRPVIIPVAAAALAATVALAVPSFAADDADRDCVGSYEYNTDVSDKVHYVSGTTPGLYFGWIHLRAELGSDLEVCLDFDDDVRGTGKLTFYAGPDEEIRRMHESPGTGRLLMSASVVEDGWFRITAQLDATRLREQFIMHVKGDIVDFGEG